MFLKLFNCWEFTHEGLIVRLYIHYLRGKRSLILIFFLVLMIFKFVFSLNCDETFSRLFCHLHEKVVSWPQNWDSKNCCWNRGENENQLIKKTLWNKIGYWIYVENKPKDSLLMKIPGKNQIITRWNFWEFHSFFFSHHPPLPSGYFILFFLLYDIQNEI